jgi:hypothetical protein
LKFDNHIVGSIAFGDLTIPDDVTKIGDFAFYDCANLTSLTFNKNNTEIGEYAFADTTNVNNITFINFDTAPTNWNGENIFSNCGNNATEWSIEMSGGS